MGPLMSFPRLKFFYSTFVFKSKNVFTHLLVLQLQLWHSVKATTTAAVDSKAPYSQITLNPVLSGPWMLQARSNSVCANKMMRGGGRGCHG